MRTAAVTHSENNQPTQRQPCRPNRANKFHLCVACRCSSEVFTLTTVVVAALCKMLQEKHQATERRAQKGPKKWMENFSICRRTEMLLPAFLVFPLFNFPLYHHLSVGRRSSSVCLALIVNTRPPTDRQTASTYLKKKLFIQLTELNVIIVVVSSLSHSNSRRRSKKTHREKDWRVEEWIERLSLHSRTFVGHLTFRISGERVISFA